MTASPDDIRKEFDSTAGMVRRHAKGNMGIAMAQLRDAALSRPARRPKRGT